jgi:hypothetical protein
MISLDGVTGFLQLTMALNRNCGCSFSFLLLKSISSASYVAATAILARRNLRGKNTDIQHKRRYIGRYSK